MFAFLNIVLNKGAHKAKKNEVKKRWNAVNEAFFNHDKLQPFRLDVYKEGIPRKLRDKYQQVLTAGKEVLESDNKLDIPDEFRARYQLLQMTRRSTNPTYSIRKLTIEV